MEPSKAQRQGLTRSAVIGILVVVAAICMVVGGLVGGSLGLLAGRSAPAEGPVRPDVSATDSADTARDPGTIAAMVASALPGVVSISVEAGMDSGTGSGFVFREDGYIVTNNHVVSAAANDGGTIEVVMADGTRMQATLVGRNVSYDIALLSVDADGLPALPIGDSDALAVGDTVVAIGAPLGLDGTVTAGIVSALDRPVTAGDQSEASYISAIQTDAAINPGNSGGPLLNGAGEVVGVNSAIATLASGGRVGSIGLGFAIPVDAVARIAGELLETGTSSTPIIGITLDTRFAGPGALVGTVTPRGPAAGAGIRPGDVIVSIDGRTVANADELVIAIRDNSPGDTIDVVVEREGSPRTFQVTLEAQPAE